MRYELNCDEDKVIDVLVVGGGSYDLKGCCKVMNEQQSTISTMTEENKELGKNFEDLVDWASKIANRNVVLDEQIGQLQRENEQLRKELSDCEKFRYQVFKRIGELL